MKTKTHLHPALRISMGLFLLTCTSPWIQAAQPFVQRGDGTWVPWHDPAPESMRPFQSLASKRGPQFNYTFDDVNTSSGVGFDDPQTGLLRRGVFQAVLVYLGTVIQDPGAVDIVVSVSQTDGSGFLAKASPMFPAMDGVFGGFVFDHITTGTDPCEIYDCDEDGPDMLLQVDFGHAFYTGTDLPDPAEYDLFTVLFQEMVQALGWLSLSSAQGHSMLPTATFSLWDDKLFTGTHQKLWVDGALAVPQDAFIGNQAGILFGGRRTMRRFGQFVPVHAPDPFVAGSSLGFWNSQLCMMAVMSPEILPGLTRRAFQPHEIAVLHDLGYRIDMPRSGPSFSAETRLGGAVAYLTAIQSDENWETTLAVANDNERSVLCHITAHAASGWPLGVFSATLPPNGHFRGKVSQIFGQISPGISWVRVQSDVLVKACSLVRSKDGTQAYAVNGVKRLSADIYLPHIAQDTTVWFTSCNVVNGGVSSTDVDLFMGDVQLELEHHRRFSSDGFNILTRNQGTLPDASWGRLIDRHGRASIAGHELFGRVDGTLQSAAVEFKNPDPIDPEGIQTLVFPHIARDVAQFWTGFAFVNTSNTAREMTLRAWGSGGLLIGEKSFTLEGYEKRISLADAFLDGVGTPDNVDWVETQTRGDIIGLELFGTHDGKRLAGLEATGQSSPSLAMTYLIPDGTRWHGLALVNPGDADAQVSFSVFNQLGSLLHPTQSQPILAKEKKVMLVTDLFATLSEVASWVKIESDQPLIGFELIGTHDGETMAGILLQ